MHIVSFFFFPFVGGSLAIIHINLDQESLISIQFP